MSERNQRILIVDDNAAIHDDFRKVLGASGADDSELVDLESALFGQPDEAAPADPGDADEGYEILSARQGAEALEIVRAAREEGRPIALAFVDVRMPPGWDGVETLKRIWEIDPDLQAVLCTAFSDYTWSETVNRLGRGDRLLILKKPFDAIEVCQLASALVEKWNVTRSERLRLEEVRAAEQEARAYAASLETVNRALETTLATSEESNRARSEFLLHVTHELLQPMADLLGRAIALSKRAPESEAWKSMLEQLCREGGALRALLADIVDLSDIEAGALRANEEPCEPYAIARAAVEGAGERAAAARVTLRMECVSPVPERIRSDPAWLARILERLVANAIERSPQGEEVRLQLSLEPTAGWQEPQLRFELTDAGERIPGERAGRLFEPFQGGPGSSPGLGLSKRLAHQLGGDLSVQGEQGTGTSFVLTVRTGALDGVSMLP